MADENLDMESVRISELDQTTEVDREKDYLVVSRHSDAYIDDEKSFKITPDDLLAGVGVNYNAGAHIAIDNNTHTISATYTNATTSEDGLMSKEDKSTVDSLQPVATSGDYNDLTNKPTIPVAQVNSDWNSTSGVSEILNKPTLATVATTGDYSDLSNTPTIPDAISDLTDDVSITNPENDEVLKYDATSSKWVNAAAPAGASALGDLTDVAISAPSNNQALLYDNTTHTWINKAVEGTVPVKDTASGAIATFETNMADVLQEVKCSINPIQSGSGTPYPEGGGRNLFGVKSRVNTTVAQVVYTSDEDYFYLNGTKSGGGYADMANATLTLGAGTYYLRAFVISGTASGTVSLYAFDGSDNISSDILGGEKTMTLSATTTFRFRFAIWQDGTVCSNYKVGIVVSKTSDIDRYYTYSNIRPIEGYTEANITRCGVNLWNEHWELGRINNTGEKEYAVDRIVSKNYIPVKPSTEYYTYIGGYDITLYGCRRWAYDENFNSIGQIGSDYTVKFTTPANCKYILFSPNVQYGTSYLNNISINYPSTDTTYHPYNGQTYTIAFGQTVYGGVLDVTRGKLHVTHDRATFDGTEVYQLYGTTVVCNKYFTAGLGSHLDMKCSHQVNSQIGYANADKTRFEFRNIDTSWGVADLDAFKTFIATQYANGTPVTIKYPLNTPFDIDLTPEQIEALLGVNNVWHDGNGNTEVKYYTSTAKDIKDFIKTSIDVDDLANVDITTPEENQVLKYNGTQWVNATSPAGATNLDGLTDVTIATPTAGQALVYNGTSGEWENNAVDYANIANKPTLATVATSGSYTDLSNTPTIPAAQVNADWDSTSGVSEILNKPTIPTVNDATITVVQGSTTKGTFTLNQSTNATITLDAGGSGGASALDDLTDVDITNPTANQVLKYDGTSWINGTGGGSGAEYVELTQSEYDALTPAEKKNGTMYFITDSSESGSGEHITLTQAEYDALVQAGTVDPDAFYFISDTNGDGQNFQPVIYSTEEREIGVWTDGKPLYMKRFVLDNGSDIEISSTSWTDTHVQFSNSDVFVNCFGVGGLGSFQGTLFVQAVNGTIRVMTPRNSNAWVAYLFVQYTKSTDTAGSGTWTPQGVPSHHYSTSEQVVGTWIDGKTVYERTIIGTTTDSTNTEVNKTIFDGTGFVDKYISADGTLQSGAEGYDNQVLNGYVNATNHVGFYKPSGGSKEVRIYYNSSAYPSGSTYVVTIRYTKSSS